MLNKYYNMVYEPHLMLIIFEEIDLSKNVMLYVEMNQ